MKILTLLFAFTLIGSASTLPESPVATPDGQSLDPLAPGLGAQVYAIPGSVWQVDFNEGSDYDFNDAMTLLTFGPNDTATLNYGFGNTANIDLVSLPGGSWLFVGNSEQVSIPENGQVVPVNMLDVSVFQEYSTGPAVDQIDNVVHGFVSQQNSAAPEPAGWLLITIGMFGIAVGTGKRLKLVSMKERIQEAISNLLAACRHQHLGLPITMDGLTYQRCTDCAARVRVTVDLNQDRASIR